MTVPLRPNIRPTRMSASAVFSIHCDGPPLVEADGAMGFLSFVEHNATSQPSDPNASFVLEFERLHTLFPDFPSLMLKILLLREEGRGQMVYQQLISRGWTPTRRPSKRDRLANESNALFVTNYYWGMWRPEYVKTLSKQKPGTFLTGYRLMRNKDRTTPNELQYCVWVVDHKRRVRKWTCTSP